VPKTLVSPDPVPPGDPYSPGVRAGDWLYLAGQGGRDPGTGDMADDIAAQTEQTFRNIERLLGAADASLDDVVSCLVHLTDLANFQGFNEVFARRFQGVKPVRTTVEANLLAGMLVEITVVAYLGE